MGKIEETEYEIGYSIQGHIHQECSDGNIRHKAIARVRCTVTNSKGIPHLQNYWIINGETYQKGKDGYDITGARTIHGIGKKIALEDDGIPVSKNTRLGELLIRHHSGTHSYRVPDMYRRKVFHENKAEIHNKTTYTPLLYDARELEIRMACHPDKVLRYQHLSLLLDAATAELEKKREEAKRIAEERRKTEEQERLRALEEEERKIREESEKLERQIEENRQKLKSVQSFMRKNVSLRSQHILDSSQEEAKRSHIFDGIPVVIDGGPGTGKTTTMIQRLKFLLSYEALKDYGLLKEDGGKFSEEQLTALTDPQRRDEHWLFFSPTELLLRYLQENMREEGLRANDRNTRTIAKFRNKAMNDYRLFNSSKNGSFKDYRIKSEEEKSLIQDVKGVIKQFELHILKECNKTFVKRCDFNTSKHAWHKDALRIKATCKSSGEIKDIDTLMNLFISLQENERDNIKVWAEKLRDQLNVAATKLQRKILMDEECATAVGSVFERWRRERMAIEEPDEEEAIIDEEEESAEISLDREQFETQLYKQLKQLIRQLGLKKHDSKIKISKRNQEILAIVKPLVSEEELNIDYIGSVALFIRNYASLCRGIEKNLVGIIPTMYKSFRKETTHEELYRAPLLKKIINKGTKYLHPDEQSFILGFINELLHRIYRKSKLMFSALKHPYALAFKESVRNVIGIDEATDYSLLDYYFMISFRHYDFSSITLCGDLMQGLNPNGITDWTVIRDFNLPNLEVQSLNISYRQLPTLVDVARELYHDDLGVYPSYHSSMQREDSEPVPQMLISDDEEEKAIWISDHILRILHDYDNNLPSIAIFVGDQVDIPEFIERLTDLDHINGIDVVDCSGNNQMQNEEVIRVFRISEVKGMEFEAAFFYDIDTAMQSQSEDLMRRYLYVGISRATSHLYATMTTDEHSEISKHFDARRDY